MKKSFWVFVLALLCLINIAGISVHAEVYGSIELQGPAPDTVQAGSFNIDGTGVIGTSLQTPKVTSVGDLSVVAGTTLSLQSGVGAINMLSGVRFFPSDQTFTSLPAPFVDVSSTYTLDFAGASFGGGLFGSPDGVYNFAPTINFSQNGNMLSAQVYKVDPIYKNTNGATITVGALSSFVSSPTYEGDGALFTIGPSADYSSNMHFKTINGGTLAVSGSGDLVNYETAITIDDGVTISQRYEGFQVQAPVISGTGKLVNMSAFRVQSIGNTTGNLIGLSIGNLTGSGTNIGVDIAKPSGGTTNIGLRNYGTTVYPRSSSSLSSASSMIDSTTTSTGLINTSGGALTLTSTPTIANGVDGQILYIYNPSGNDVSLKDESVLPGSNLRLGTATRTLHFRDSITLMFSATLNDWYVISVSGGESIALQSSTPGVTQTGNLNISGTGLFGTAIKTPTVTSSATLAISAGSNLSLQSANSNAVSLDSGTTGAVNIGTNANAKAITLGNITGATALNLLTGSGNFSLNGQAGTSYTIGAATTTGTINIGGSAQTGAISLGTGAGTGNRKVTIGSLSNYSTTTIQGGAIAGAISLQVGTNGIVAIGSTSTSTVNIGTGAFAHAINIGTNATTTQTISLGSTASTSTTLIQGGSGTGALAAIRLISNNSGDILIGGSAQTGAITIGQSTDNQTLNFGTGATPSGKTLTIHIGDAGIDGSTTNITIGSSVAGTLAVQSAANFNKAITVGGHIISANTTGTTSAEAGAAATCTQEDIPNVSINGNDTAGTVTITTATGDCAAGTLATITFANNYESAPRVTLTPANANAATLQYYNGSSLPTAFTIDININPSASTTYIYNYQIIQ